MAELDQLDPPQAGKAGILAALQKVRDNLTALKASAKAEWGSQVTELDGAIDAFQTTIAGVDGDSLLGDLPAIVADLERIDTAWTALRPADRPDLRLTGWNRRSDRPLIVAPGPSPRLVQSVHDDGGLAGAGRRASPAARDAQGGRAGSRLGRARLR